MDDPDKRANVSLVLLLKGRKVFEPLVILVGGVVGITLTRSERWPGPLIKGGAA